MVQIVGQSDEFKYRVTCRSCSSVLEYTQSEIREKRTNFDYLGGYDIYRGIDCPKCGSFVRT